MFWIVLSMFVIVCLASLIVVYVAFPHRGHAVPKAPWVGEKLARGVEKLPTLSNRR